MNANINLLLRTDEESLRRKKKIKIFNLTAAASLISVGLISLVIFILIQAVNPAAINKEQEDVLGKISQYKNQQDKLFVINDRIENIGKILTLRGDLAKKTNGLLTKIPGGIMVESFEVNDESAVISGQSQSLLVISEFIDNLTDMVRKKEIIKSLTLNSLIMDEIKNTYRVSIKAKL